MNKTIRLLATTTAALLLAACTDQTDPLPGEDTPEVLRNVTLTPEVPLEIETRATTYTDAIKNVYIFQTALEGDENAGIGKGFQVGNSPYYYEVENPTAGSPYNVTLPTLLNIKSKIYIIANSSYIDMEVAKKWTDRELEQAQLGKAVTLPEDMPDENGYLWMTAIYEGFPTPRIDIPLKHTAAQITFDLKTELPAGHQFYLISIQLKQVEGWMTYFPWTVVDWHVDYPETTIYPVTWLLPENPRGTGTGTTETEKGAANAPSPYCTYIEVKGLYQISGQWISTQYVTFQIFPGANNFNDYNVMRNTKYNITTTIKGINRADTRIIVNGNAALDAGIYLDYTDNCSPWFAIHSTLLTDLIGDELIPSVDSSTATGTDGSICPAGFRIPTEKELVLMYVYSGVIPPKDALLKEEYWGAETKNNGRINCMMWSPNNDTGALSYVPSNISAGFKRALRCVRDF